jgi:trigger factor
VDASDVDVDGPVVDSRTRALLESFDEMLRRRGGSLETYIQVTGTSPDELVARFQAEAQRSVAGELVLEAVADQLDIQITDEQVDEAIRERFEDADSVIEQLRAGGAYETERESLRLSTALDRVAAEVKRIPLEQERARDAIWTPDKETPKTETKLWTPGSKEPA